MDKIWEWIDNIKNEDRGVVLFLKWFYSVGKISWIHAIISTFAGILIPIFYERSQYIYMTIFSVCVILDILYAYICNEYQKKLFTNRKFTSELLEEFSSLIKSLSIYVQNEAQWKNKIYKTTSEMVCEKLYSIFRDVFKCETRISVEFIFQKTYQERKSEQYVKMAGRKSRHRSKTRKSVPLERKNKYYSYHIFVQNNKGMNILEEDEINDSNIWYKSSDSAVDVKRYIGIAVSVFNDDKVNFILQVDFLKDFRFGKDDSQKDIQNFVDRYLLPYVNMVTLAYLLNLNGKKELIEV